MGERNVYVYIFLMWFATYLLRVVPLTLIRKPLKNRFIRSFLYYTPYVTLAVMTFPAMIDASEHPAAGIAALAAGTVAAWFGAGLFPVAVITCTAEYLVGLL